MPHSRGAILAPIIVLLCGITAWAETDPTVPEPGRILLVHPNVGVRASEEVAPGIEPVWQEILHHFAAQGRAVTAIEPSSGRALWNQVMAKAQAGADADDVYEAYGRYARRIAEQVDYDAIVFPSLVTRAAKVRGRTAHWDGVRQPVETPALPPVRIGASFVAWQNGVRGQLAAASLHVAVLEPTGRLRFEGTGGLAVLQKLTRSADTELVAKLRDDAFSDADALRHGVEAAFRAPLPASPAD